MVEADGLSLRPSYLVLLLNTVRVGSLLLLLLPLSVLRAPQRGKRRLYLHAINKSMRWSN